MLTVNSNPSGTAVLFDPVQSSTHCDVGCEASIGIDGDSDTNSRTLYGNGSHWWQVGRGGGAPATHRREAVTAEAVAVHADLDGHGEGPARRELVERRLAPQHLPHQYGVAVHVSLRDANVGARGVSRHTATDR